jgi:AraC-like DNA-binding protein
MTDISNGAMPPLSQMLGRIALLGAEWVRIRVAPGEGFTMPAGDHFAAHFVIRGQFNLIVEQGSPEVFRAGGTAILPHGTRHSLRCEGATSSARLDCFDDPRDLDIPRSIDIGAVRDEDAAVVLSAQLHLDWPVELPRPQSLPAVLLGTRTYLDDRSAAETAARALDITARRPGATVCLSRFAELLLARELRDVLLAHPELFRSRDELTAAMVRAIDAVRMKPAHPWTVERLARYVAMSRSTFAVAFKDFYARSPMEVVTEQRMEIAAKLLRESNMRVKAIAAKVGYASDTAFLRRFTTHFGVPPTNYRRTLAAGEDAHATDWVRLLH